MNKKYHVYDHEFGDYICQMNNKEKGVEFFIHLLLE